MKINVYYIFFFPRIPGEETGIEYTHSVCGLFPAPLARNAKAAIVNKIKAKFKFIGKFMAKALMDSRMVSNIQHICFLRY